MISRSKRLITSAVISVLMVLTMMPGMAFADDSITGSITKMNVPDTIYAGVQTTVSAEYEASGEAHIDWSVEDGSGSATINKHKGQLTAVKEGTVTVTATLVTGAQPTTGGGNQQGCGGTEITHESKTVTIDKAQAYGFQGDGGNTLKLTSPSNISRGTISTTTVGDKTYNVYQNEIEEVNVDSTKYLNVEYTMSAGINNFKKDTFTDYKDDIGIYDDNGTKVSNVEYVGFDSPNVKIRFSTSNLKAGKTYTLQFGPSVRGNNLKKTLGCYINFDFTL